MKGTSYARVLQQERKQPSGCNAKARCGGGRVLDTGRNRYGSEERRWDCIQKVAYGGHVEGRGWR